MRNFGGNFGAPSARDIFKPRLRRGGAITPLEVSSAHQMLFYGAFLAITPLEVLSDTGLTIFWGSRGDIAMTPPEVLSLLKKTLAETLRVVADLWPLKLRI